MNLHIDRDDYDAAEKDYQYRLVGIAHDQILLFTDEVADVGQDRDPDSCAEKGIQGKAEMPHARQSGRQGDEVTNHGKQATKEG